MKEIKDYLHLYLGCEIDISGQREILDSVAQTGEIETLFRGNLRNYRHISDENIKPILRPLSDMTEEECSAVYTISRDRILHDYSQDDFHVIKSDKGFLIHRLDWLNEPLMLGFNGQIYSVVEEGNRKHIEPVRNQHEITKYILSKHFDLFGLIKAGLAIDKTTLK